MCAIAVKDKRIISMMFDTADQANAFVAGIKADDPPNVKLTGSALYRHVRLTRCERKPLDLSTGRFSEWLDGWQLRRKELKWN